MQYWYLYYIVHSNHGPFISLRPPGLKYQQYCVELLYVTHVHTFCFADTGQSNSEDLNSKNVFMNRIRLPHKLSQSNNYIHEVQCVVVLVIPQLILDFDRDSTQNCLQFMPHLFKDTN